MLLSHRCDSDFWCLPGGGVESGEAPWQAAVREVREEVGLEVEVERLTGLYSWVKKDSIIFLFRCHVMGGALGTSDEVNDARYFPLDALPANTFIEHVARIHDAIAGDAREGGDGRAALRIPDGPSATEQRIAWQNQQRGDG